MEQSTFSEGIAPGGLRSGAEIKLLVCYLLKALKRPLSRTQINEILQEYPIANYFEVNQAISELVKTGNILSELAGDEELMTLSGRAMFDTASIENSLPRSVREKALDAALQVLTRERIKRESEVAVEKLETGYHVTFTIRDVDTELLRLTIYASDEAQIETVKRNFFNHAVEIYSGILSSLTVE